MSKKEKNKIFSNMKNLLNETNIEKKESYEIAKKDIEKVINIEIFREMTEDEKIVNLLMNSSIELFQIQAKNAIELGKVFKNVFDELGGEGSKYTGLYEKWLNANNISKSTALRYRKRYEIYNNVLPDKRNTVTLLSQKYIDIIFLDENKDNYIELINKGANPKEIVEIIENQDKVEVIENKTETVNVDIFNHIPKFLSFSSEVNNKIEKLDDKKKRDLRKYLIKINEILK